MNRLISFARDMRQRLSDSPSDKPPAQSPSVKLQLLAGIVMAFTLGAAPVHAQVVIGPAPLTTSATSVNPVFNTGTATLPISSYAVAAVASTKTTPAIVAMPTYTGFKIQLSNPSNGETVNGISFTATVTSVNNAGLATYTSAQAPQGRTLTCTRGAGTTTTAVVTCTVSGSLSVGQSLDFTLFFTSPAKKSTGVEGASCTSSTADCLRLTGVTRYNTIKQVQANAVSVLLGSGSSTNRNKRAFTAVPKTGAKLYTGFNLTTIYGEFFSQVDIPSTTGYTSASINEVSYAANTLFGGINCANFTTCWTSEITVPPPAGQSSFSPSWLTITLRADASFTPNATRTAILNAPTNYTTVVPVYYYASAGNTPTVIGACPVGGGAIVGAPCIASRQVVTSTTVGATTGDIIWTIRNFNNGGYMLR